ncbi:NAD-dependent epimerase/dehydratase family protein [Flavobacterium sp.]|uniref:NAD-dependent epimerase/dehydratase family protein n=1 Tax=Flavobacterium sp. TaxID=239 RepID=UPI0025F821AA|nr:NAD-dependent epimerase/dehydratase family protein [Flavobacterium sp.]
MILVTGGTGLVGSHLLLQLTASETEIRAIYRNGKNIRKTQSLFELYGKEDQFHKIQWMEGDIIDVPSLEKAFQGVTHVYHCAAHISYAPKDENKLRKTNIEGTANIVNFCIDYKVNKLCHVSSIAALGDLKPNETNITEETEWNPEHLHSDYAISKYGAEMEIWRGQQEGLNVVIVNPGVIFGAGFWDQGSGLFFSAIQKGFPFYTNGTTGYVSATDVATIMIRLMKSDISGERFSVVAENRSFKDIISQIAEKLGAKKPKWEAKPWMLAIGWRLDWLSAAFFNTQRKLTKYSAKSLLTAEDISNAKIKNALNFEFQRIDTVIDEVIRLHQK